VHAHVSMHFGVERCEMALALVPSLGEGCASRSCRAWTARSLGGSFAAKSFARPVVQKDAEVRCKWWARVDRAETEVVVVGWHRGHHPQAALEAVVACCVPDPCGVASNPMDVKKQTLPSTGLSRATISISGTSCPSCPALAANPDVRGTSLLYHVSMPHTSELLSPLRRQLSRDIVLS